MVDSKLEVVGCSMIEGEEHGPMSQQTWVLALGSTPSDWLCDLGQPSLPEE